MLRASNVTGLLVLGLGLLVPAALRAAEGPEIGGNYTCKGMNPDGKEYTGSVKITKQGDVYHLKWTIGQGSQSGVGIREENTLAVSWVGAGGASGVVVYKIGKDKRLVGRWAVQGGKDIYTETLTPE
jgi:hypothetical protein